MGDLIAVFGIDVRMIVVQIINFTLLLSVLWYFLYRPLLSFIDRRRGDIIASVEKAEAAERALARAEAERLQMLAQASTDAAAIIQAARGTATAKATAIVADAEAAAARLLADTQASAEEAKRQMIAQGKEEIARMVVLAAEQALKSTATHVTENAKR